MCIVTFFSIIYEIVIKLEQQYLQQKAREKDYYILPS